MRLARFILWSGIVVLLVQSSCKSPTEPTTGVFLDTHVRGRVTRSDGLGGEPGVTVRDLTLSSVSSTTDSSGNFDLLYSIDERLVTSILAIKSGFVNHANDTIAVTIDPGVDVTGAALVLGVDSSSPPPGTTSTGIAASIVLIGSGVTNLSIKGTGSNETTVLTFEVRDSLGFPISSANQVTVTFQILGGPGGGEYVNPTSAPTDGKGRVTTRVSSGTRTGVLQVYAYARNDSVSASPVRVTISGGFPDPNHITLQHEKVNVAAGVGVLAGDNLKVGFQVLIGDQFGNPVPKDIAVSFTTTGGLITPTGATNDQGIATAQLTTGNPRPSGGKAVVTARTVGDSGTVVSQNDTIIFSGATTIASPIVGFSVPDSGSSTPSSITFEVQDQFGNPLQGGSTINVSLKGDAASALTLEGDINVTVPDTKDPKYTDFSVKITKKTKGPPGGQVVLRIEVSSPNNPTASVEFKEIPGVVSTVGGGGGGGGGGGFGGGNATADKMELASVSKPSIIVNDGSNSDKSISTLTFLVKDSVGNPVINVFNPSQAKVYVTFAVQGFSPQGFPISGGEQLLILADSTNEFSQVSTRLLAGTRSGIFKIIATVVGGPAYDPLKGPITAVGEVIIKAGPPDAAHFGIFANKYNFPGLEIIAESVTDGITAAVGDKFGNPVEQGTRVYFDAVHGFVTPEGQTNANGFLTVNLFAALPKPIPPYSQVSYGGPGWGLVRARTIGDGGVELNDSVLILWTGKPIIDSVSGPTSFAVPDNGSAGPWTFKVYDYLYHPMTSGTTIRVTAGDALVTGNESTTLIDFTFGGNGITDFSFGIADNDPFDTDPAKFTSIVITVTHPVYGSRSYTVATGTVD